MNTLGKYAGPYIAGIGSEFGASLLDLGLGARGLQGVRFTDQGFMAYAAQSFRC